MFPIKDVSISGPFWAQYQKLAREKVIPYQWEALNDRIPGAEPSYCMRNFRTAADIVAGKKTEVQHGGCVFQDSDFAKWIEAVAYSLAIHPDAALEKLADEAIDLVCAAQEPDGYLDTYYIINGLDKRWTNLRDHHELYCMGHLIEGAVAYYEATGKRKLLEAMIRYVQLVFDNFGREAGKIPGYPGHEIVEMALVRLYAVTKDERHLHLAQYFIDQRGQEPNYFEWEMQRYHNRDHWSNGPLKLAYYQAHKPLRQQEAAVGHAVRAMYLYSGMTDCARLSGDESLIAACKRLWRNVVSKQMYITGAVGASDYGESFTFDYDLPNDTVYAETCAQIGLVFFARRMIDLDAGLENSGGVPSSEYADVMERALYNGVISGMSLSGDRFFYVNPLEVWPEASEKDALKTHVKLQRQAWFGCACCPPNLARVLTGLGMYAYGSGPLGASGNALFVHLYTGGRVQHEGVVFQMETNYPWSGLVQIKVQKAAPGLGQTDFPLALRVPAWCKQQRLNINGVETPLEPTKGYSIIERQWREGDIIELRLDMPVRMIEANPLLRADIGKRAVMRGPLVYCVEEADNGKNLHLLRLAEDPAWTVKHDDKLLGGIDVITARGKRFAADWPDETLYREAGTETGDEAVITMIPYYAWANRAVGEMRVWL